MPNLIPPYLTEINYTLIYTKTSLLYEFSLVVARDLLMLFTHSNNNCCTKNFSQLASTPTSAIERVRQSDLQNSRKYTKT